MKSDASKQLQDYVEASLKQGAELTAAAKEFPRTTEGMAQRAAAIQAELQKCGFSN
jgi:hypothetical protein